MLSKAQIRKLLNDKYGSSPASWMITTDETFDNWDGNLTTRKSVIDTIAATPGKYLIRPYYSSNLPNAQNSRSYSTEFREDLVITNQTLI